MDAGGDNYPGAVHDDVVDDGEVLLRLPECLYLRWEVCFFLGKSRSDLLG